MNDKKQIQKTNSKKNGGRMPPINIVPFLILYVGFWGTFAYDMLVHFDLQNEMLQKYYTADVIKRDNLSLRTGKVETRVSNGDILPQDAHEYMLYEQWKRR
jgi:hypothetical protein